MRRQNGHTTSYESPRIRHRHAASRLAPRGSGVACAAYTSLELTLVLDGPFPASVEPGANRFPVSVLTRYNECTPRRAPLQGGPRCVGHDGTKSPPLPPGKYWVVLIGVALALPPSPPVLITPTRNGVLDAVACKRGSPDQVGALAAHCVRPTSRVGPIAAARVSSRN